MKMFITSIAFLLAWTSIASAAPASLFCEVVVRQGSSGPETRTPLKKEAWDSYTLLEGDINAAVTYGGEGSMFVLKSGTGHVVLLDAEFNARGRIILTLMENSFKPNQISKTLTCKKM